MAKTDLRAQALKQFIIFLLLLAGLMQISACSLTKVESWERGNLANPVMIRDTSAHHGSLEQHTYLSKEATQGGYSIGAGGCGCN